MCLTVVKEMAMVQAAECYGCSLKSRLGTVFHGTNGTLAANYRAFKIFSEGNCLDPNKLSEPSIPPSPGYTREWLDKIKTRKRPFATSDTTAGFNLQSALVTSHFRLVRESFGMISQNE